MDMRLEPNLASAGWPWIDGRRDIPGVVATVRAAGRGMTLGPEAAAEVTAWTASVGWELNEAPVLLLPVV
jgi:hypothetical protein